MFAFDVETGHKQLLHEFPSEYCCIGGRSEGRRGYTYDSNLDMFLMRLTHFNRCGDSESTVWLLNSTGTPLHLLNATLMSLQAEGIFLLDTIVPSAEADVFV